MRPDMTSLGLTKNRFYILHIFIALCIVSAFIAFPEPTIFSFKIIATIIAAFIAMMFAMMAFIGFIALDRTPKSEKSQWLLSLSIFLIMDMFIYALWAR